MNTSFKFLSLLTVAGVITSCFADSYQDGQKAFSEKNYADAITYFTKSCESGNAKGCFSLGNMYENGEGTAQNKYQAVALYTQACRSGEPLGCGNMALRYDTP